MNYVLAKLDVKILNFDVKSAMKLYELLFFHKDPFDRMIISQALTNDLTVSTVDEKFTFYEKLGLKLLES